MLKENGKGIESEGDVKEMNEDPAEGGEEPAPIEENAEEPVASEPLETEDTETKVDEEVGDTEDAVEEMADGEDGRWWTRQMDYDPDSWLCRQRRQMVNMTNGGDSRW